MIRIYSQSLLLVVLWYALTNAGHAAADAESPNFVVVMADDMGFSDAGCYGGEIRTPHLDALAEEGLRFTQFYSTGRCWPSRSVLLTGYYAQQVGMDPRKGKTWPQWTRLVSQHLGAKDYRCYHSGKWHVRSSPANKTHSGFDRSYWTRNHDRFFSPQNHLLDDEPLAAIPRGSGYYATTAIADRAIEFLKEHQTQHASKPFYLYVAYIAPHFPLQALPEDIARYRNVYVEGWDVVRRQRWERIQRAGLVQGSLSQRRPDVVAPWSWSEAKLQEHVGPGESARAVAWEDLTSAQKDLQAQKMAIHAAMVDRLDRETGRVMKQVEAMGAADNTVFIFVSDNGASAEQIIRGDMHDKGAALGSGGSYLCLGPGWSTAANTPFSLHKHWNHEGGISSPLIVHWPRGIRTPGELRHSPGHFVDLVPTILDLAGIDAQATGSGVQAPPFPGRSLRPAFDKDPGWERTFFFSHAENHALRHGNWKAVVRTQNDEQWELYNVAKDRSETDDLAARQPEKLERLRAEWRALRDRFEVDRTR